MQKPAVIAIDLDFTLAHFEGGYDAIYKAVIPFGIRKDDAKEVLRRTIDSAEGFNFERYVDALRESDLKADWNAMLDTLNELLVKNFSLYPDSRKFLEFARSQNIPIVLITAGNERFQKAKIDIVAYSFDDVHITDLPKGKGDIIYKLQQQYEGHVWYIDDKRRELDRIFTTPKVKKARISLFEIERPDASHKEKSKDPRFAPIQSLTPLIKYL